MHESSIVHNVNPYTDISLWCVILSLQKCFVFHQFIWSDMKSIDGKEQILNSSKRNSIRISWHIRPTHNGTHSLHTHARACTVYTYFVKFLLSTVYIPCPMDSYFLAYDYPIWYAISKNRLYSSKFWREKKETISLCRNFDIYHFLVPFKYKQKQSRNKITESKWQQFMQLDSHWMLRLRLHYITILLLLHIFIFCFVIAEYSFPFWFSFFSATAR